MSILRNPISGRFMSKSDYEALVNENKELQERTTALTARVDALVEQEKSRDDTFIENLKDVIVALANFVGVTPEDFTERIEVYHPTPEDPVLLIDGKAVMSWI